MTTISKKVTTKGSTLEEDSRSNAREEEGGPPQIFFFGRRKIRHIGEKRELERMGIIGWEESEERKSERERECVCLRERD